jgi:phenylalanyl-tRNA synthetase alpha chain
MDDLLEKINNYKTEISDFIAEKAEETEAFRIKYLGTKGLVKEVMGEMKNVAADKKREFGQIMNEFKLFAEAKYDALKAVTSNDSQAAEAGEDLSLPADQLPLGSRHPISLVRNRIVSIFQRLGFAVAEGPEIEDDWHNFTALNTPENHPARDMQDTFYVELNPEMVLRTQTSSVQVHIMENQKPPIRTISPGRVYRNEAISARAHCQFHQIEGLYIDEKVSFADLKQTLNFFAKELFGTETKIRMRPSYFPFTEPSAEVDISCTICKGEGCNVCKYTGWVEILGCGMVDPQVLENCGIDSKKYSGFAFGMGIERITMLKYRVKDLRLFFENDVRFLKQFAGE